jgi:dTDP-4-dehydrorhamnose 3,5-epimerase
MSGEFVTTLTAIKGVVAVERHPRGDHRGYLARLFCMDELAPVGWDSPIAQINHTYTAKSGTIRGLHFQSPPTAEKKLVVCLRGMICDVAADLRKDSATFLQHHKEILSAENHKALLIPEGCAHGFQTLTNDVELIYLHSEKYSASHEGGVSPFDETLAISWPKPVSAISDRDRLHPALTSNYEGLRL